MKESKYHGNPIASISSLSAALDVPEDILLKFSNTADDYYKQNTPEIKSNGKERITYRVDDSLKAIQDKIKVRIFQQMTFPLYLQGSIRDIKNPRDYISDAKIHTGKRIIISEDVSDFFPSIKYNMVLRMWMYIFKFPEDISIILTKLTTYRGFCPQGSKTSSYIANLIFWNNEPTLYQYLKNQDITYSRYVDDITISFDRYVNKEELSKIISKAYGMMIKAGVKPNRSKHTIKSKKSNTQVHNLNVNNLSPTITKKKRNNLRMSIFNCVKLAKKHKRHTEEYRKIYQSTITKIGQLGRLHPHQSAKLKNQLIQYKPT